MTTFTRTLSRALFAGGLVATPIGLFVVQRDWSLPRCKSTELLTGRTVVITGANSGMGKELANVLAVKGGRVIMACRNMEQCEEVRKKFIEATFNRQIVCKHLDLASLDSVRTFAKDISDNEKRLNILVNNAGVMGLPEKEVTKEGFEKHFGVNYLGPFLLTNLLLDKMKKCSTSTVPGRIINISCGRNKKRIYFPDLNFMNNDYNWKDAYSQSKSAVLLFTQELSKRTEGTNVKTFAVNPGLVNTELGTKYTKHGKSKVFSFFTAPFRFLSQKGVAEGIQTVLMCCIDSNLNSESGKYYENCREAEPETWDEIDKERIRLWAISERWTHLDEESKTKKS